MSANTNLTPGWIILAQQNYAIRFQPDAYVIDFKVFGAAESWHGDEDSSKPGTWELFNGQEGFPLELWEQAEWEIDAGVKWDGCINWQTNESCMMHGCSPGHADEIAVIFGVFYTVAKRYFDLLGDEVKPLPEGAFDMLEGQTPKALAQ